MRFPTVLARSPAACRQLATRARKSLETEKRRYAPSEAQIRHTADAFRTAIERADPQHQIKMFAEDAELITDGGGKVLAALNIIHGGDNIGRFFYGIWSKALNDFEPTNEMVWINDQPALAVSLNGVLDQTFAFDLNEEGKITTVYLVRNPDKLENIKKAFAHRSFPAA